MFYYKNCSQQCCCSSGCSAGSATKIVHDNVVVPLVAGVGYFLSQLKVVTDPFTTVITLSGYNSIEEASEPRLLLDNVANSSPMQ